MRLAFTCEFFTSRDLRAVSSVTGAMNLFHRVRALTPLFVEWLLPKRGGEMRWDDAEFDRPWIRPWTVDESELTENWYNRPLSSEAIGMFRPHRGRVVIDAIYSQKCLQSPALALAMHGSGGQWSFVPEIPVVSYYAESSADKRLPVLSSPPGLALTAAMALAGPVIVPSSYESEVLHWQLRKLLTPEQVGRATIEVMPPAFDADRVDRHRPTIERLRKERLEKDRTVWVYHSGSMEAKRQLPKIAAAVEEASRTVPMVFLLKTHKAVSGRWPASTRVLAVTQTADDYVLGMTRGDILAVANEYEGTGLAYMEGIRSGMLPVVMEYPWIKERLPKSYPYRVRPGDWAEFGRALAEVGDGLQVLKERWSERLIRHLDGWTPDAAAGAFVRIVGGAVDRAAQANVERVRKWQPMYDVLGAALHKEGFTEIEGAEGFAYVRRAMQNASRSDMKFSTKPLELYWLLQAHGFDDLCDGPEPHMVREPR